MMSESVAEKLKFRHSVQDDNLVKMGWRSKLKSRKIDLFEMAENAFSKYIGVTVKAWGAGLNFAAPPFSVNPTFPLLWEGLFPKFRRDANEDICPLGEVAQMAPLFIGRSGKVYLTNSELSELFLFANSIDSALLCLLDGRLPPESNWRPEI